MKKDPNMFEAAAKKKGSKKKEESKSSPKKKNAAEPAKRKYKDPEIDEMMRKIHDMRHDLLTKLEYIRYKAGLNFDDLQRFMDNPKNFTPAEWEKMQQTKMNIGEKAWAAIGVDLKEKAAQAKMVKPGDRKHKTLGARKKWIPVR